MRMMIGLVWMLHTNEPSTLEDSEFWTSLGYI